MSNLNALISLKSQNTIITTIGAVSTFRRGSFPQPYGKAEWYDGDGAMPFVQVADIGEDMQLVNDTKKKISIIAQPMSVFAPKGSIIISLQGSIGRIAVTQYDAYIDRTVAIFSNISSNISPRYFVYQLQRIFTIKKQTARGGTIKTITKEEFTEFPIVVPPLEVQEEIVRILDEYSEKNTQLIAALSAELDARKVQYEYYREKLMEPCDGWVKSTLLETLTQAITDGPHETPKLVETGVPFISAEALSNNQINFDLKRGYITEEYDEICCKKYRPQLGDIYMCKSGSTTGKVAMVETKERFNIWSPLAAIRVDQNKILPRYMFFYLQTSMIQKQVQAKASKGSQPNLSMRKLEQFEVTYPDIDMQNRILAELDKYNSLYSQYVVILQKEIESRRIQYEYYRDKLLTFEEVN